MRIHVVAAFSLLLLSAPTLAWGPAGHRLVGLAAEPLLCPLAVEGVRTFGGGDSLDQIGQWADEIRGLPQWRHSAPWHYVNVPDAGDPRRPPPTDDGNVIVAIERFTRELADSDAEPQRRTDALRFVVHFVADVHQPLHVGRADDRGGNEIAIDIEGERRNLHYFWDTAVIRLKGQRIEDYAAAIAPAAAAAARRDRDQNVRDWAEQVFALRDRVYAFDVLAGTLDAEYVDDAVLLAEQQLALAAAHLANTLNAAFCR